MITKEDLAIGVLIAAGTGYLLLKTASAASQSKTGIYLPIYSPAMRAASETANTALTGFPNLFTANPASGPQPWQQRPDIVTNAENLHNQNPSCKVLGYIPTGYGNQTDPNKTIAVIKQRVDLWATWNSIPGKGKLIDGIMWDETRAESSVYSFYTNITDYARGKGLSFIRINPGVKPADERFITLADVTSIFEGSNLVSEAQLQSLTYNGKYAKSKFNYIAHSTPSAAMSDAWFKMAIKYVGSIYITDDSGSNPYDTPSTYLNRQIVLLKGQP